MSSSQATTSWAEVQNFMFVDRIPRALRKLVSLDR